MSIKIQINSVEALERLLGNDQELEVEVRKSVVEAFGKSFVKSVANSTAVAEKLESMREETMEKSTEYAERILSVRDTSTGWRYSVALTDELKAKIKDAVVTQTHLLIAETISSLDIDNMVSEKVAKKLELVVHQQVTKAVTNAVVKAALKSAVE